MSSSPISDNPYRSIRAEVQRVIPETPTIKTIRMKLTEDLPFRPGQFIEMSIPGSGEAPFTPSSPCYQKEHMDVTVMKVGKVTELIHRLEPGDTVGLRGPFGRGYPLDDFAGKEVLVVGGGVGFAPLRTLMYSLFEMRDRLARLIYRGGCRCPEELLYTDEIKGWGDRPDLDMVLCVDACTLEDRWDGPVGVVTTVLDGIDFNPRNAVGVACGPPIMMKFTTYKFQELGIPDENIYLSMEKNMSCGIGKCGHCRIGSYYCCKDGPVFTYAEIKDFPGIWD
ncbi:FAD/NAD(P)-binding protein [Candidatus Fermentibacterales bacterium]|nr:FAD/NAD(P)-binding protein [Candidatus Fermentibacterales bacterium]